MKKILNFLGVIVFALLLVVGCSCKKEQEKATLIGDMSATTYNTVTLAYLDGMIEDDESFVLYIYGTTCDGCKAFKPIIEAVIQERHLRVYAVLSSQIDEDHYLASLRSTPALVVYDEGEVLFKTKHSDNKQYFDDKEGFISFLDKYTYMPTMYYISLEQLNEKISNDEEFIIYYSRSSCGDCNYLNTHFLRTFLKKNVNGKHFYIIETDAEGIRYLNGVSPDIPEEATEQQRAAAEAAAIQWQEFKDQYGLSNAYNPLGYGPGYVPTFQYYEDGEIKDMMVYFNDGEYILNDDGTYSIDMSSSYYDDNPYMNQTIKYSEYQEKLAPFFDSKLQTFLENNLVKVN